MNSNALEKVLIQGDLSQLSESDPPLGAALRYRVAYYFRVCESLGLNPLTQPFAYIKLNEKLKLYALREATEQLRRLHSVSVQIVSRELLDEIYVVTARANLLMKAESKAKRRVTLSLCGLAVLDELEVETIPDAKKQQVPELPPAISEIYRTWKSPTDALNWGATILSDLHQLNCKNYSTRCQQLMAKKHLLLFRRCCRLQLRSSSTGSRQHQY